MSNRRIPLTKQQKLDLLRDNFNSQDRHQLAELLGVSKRTIDRYIKELGLKASEDDTEDIVEKMRQAKQNVHDKKAEKQLAERVMKLEDELKVATALKEKHGFYKIPPPENAELEATAVMVASDWHIEEMIYPWQVNGVNEYNEEIAKERVRRFFQHGLKLIQKEQKAVKIKTLVLALLGDFISGSIHEELMEGNRLLPTFAIIEVQEHIESGIRYLLKHTRLEIIVPCASGNHGRMTAKRRISTESGNSLERLMYYSLAQRFKDEPRVKFVISDGYHTFVKIYETTLRFHHGHNIFFNGGVGGFTIPINKAIAQWNKARRADIDVMGHYHTFFNGGNFIVNGSLIGYSAYSLSIKASPENPVQAFFLIDSQAGLTVTCPIILTQDR